MPSWLETLDPEVRECLLDIARDERSTLFRIDPGAAAVSPLEDVASASARTAGWTPAERHLLDAYREEVALLFRNAYRAKVVQDEYASNLIQGEEPPSGPDDPRSPSEIRMMARCLASFPGQYDQEDVVRGLLGELSKESLVVSPSFDQLAIAARRLVDNEAGQLFHASALIIGGHYGEAIVLGRSVAERVLRADVGASAWSIVAHAESMNRNPRGAARAYLRSIEFEPADTHIVASSFLCALRSEDLDAARVAGAHLDNLLKPGSQDLIDLVSRYNYRAATREDYLSSRMREMIARIGPSLAPTVEAFLDGIHAA